MLLSWQYFFSYLAVILVITSTLFIFTYSAFYAYHREAQINNYAKEIAIIGERNSSVLTQMIDISNQITLSSEVSPFLFKQNPERTYRLKQQLGIYKSCSDFIYSMYLIFYNDEYIYSPQSSYRLDNFTSQAVVFEDITPDALTSALRGVGSLTVMPSQMMTGYILGTPSMKKRVVPVFAPIGYSMGKARYGTILFLVDINTYMELFDSIAPGEGDIYIVQNGQVFVSRENGDVPSEVVLQAASRMSAEQATSNLRYGSNDYTLIVSHGEQLNFDYYMLVSNDKMKLALVGSMLLFVAILTVISSLCLLLVTRFIQSRIKPIRLLHSMLLGREPSGNELIEIRNGVQKLIDENEMLHMRIEGVKTLRGSDFARKFLTGGFESLDDCLAAAEDIHLNIDMQYFIVCVLAKPQSAEYDMTPDKLNQLFDNEVTGVSCTLGLHDKVVLIAFGNHREKLFEWLSEKFSGIRACCLGATMAASAVHSDYIEGQHAYLEAETAFENRFLRGNTAIICFDDLNDSKYVAAEYSAQIVDRLSSALRARDSQRIDAALADISKVMREMNISLFMFRCLYNDILNVITSEIQTNTTTDSEQKAYSLFSLSQCLSLNDLDTMLRNICIQLAQNREDDKLDGETPEIKEAKEIIAQRFSDSALSVLSVAEELNIPPAKFPAAFKKAYQMTPHEYLTQCRMKQAIRLLSETDMPVKSIALETGYYDVSSFNRRFKACTGMTPQQYRRGSEKQKEV